MIANAILKRNKKGWLKDAILKRIKEAWSKDAILIMKKVDYCEVLS